jgi:hypothetical protein
MQNRCDSFVTPPVPQVISGDGYDTHQSWVNSLAFEQQSALEHPWFSGPKMFVPDSYTPHYRYPLVCYLHEDLRSESDLDWWFPAVSDQNYLALGVRAPFPSRSGFPGQFRWHGQRPDACTGALLTAVDDAVKEWSVHPDRIYLMGTGAGAVTALQQFLLTQLDSGNCDYSFAGVICDRLPAWWPSVIPPVMEQLTGRILFLDSGMDGEMCAAMDCLSEAGCQLESGPGTARSVESRINHWIMAAIATAIA